MEHGTKKRVTIYELTNLKHMDVKFHKKHTVTVEMKHTGTENGKGEVF